MNKIKILFFLVFSIFLVSCNDEELNKLKQENEQLKTKIEMLEQENNKLKETAEMYWQNAIESFNNKKYFETKDTLKNLIDNFPTSDLVEKAKEKIKEIELIEKKKIEEENKIIKTLPKELAKVKNALDAEKLLNDLDKKYDDTYSKLKAVISEKRNEIREKIEKEKQMQEKLKQLGIEIVNIRTCFRIDSGNFGPISIRYYIPRVDISIKNISPSQTSFSISGNFICKGKQCGTFIKNKTVEPNCEQKISVEAEQEYYVEDNDNYKKDLPNIQCNIYYQSKETKWEKIFLKTLNINKIAKWDLDLKK